MTADSGALESLVAKARDGDQIAWRAIVERYASLLWSICRRHRLSDADADDVCATVWLRLIEHLGSLKNVAALPGWLSTTTTRECLHIHRFRRRQTPTDFGEYDKPDSGPEVGSEVLAEVEKAALRIGFAELSEQCRRLLALLFAEPPIAYADISSRLGVPIGGIGPTRNRCLDRLRKTPAVAGIMTTAGSVR